MLDQEIKDVYIIEDNVLRVHRLGDQGIDDMDIIGDYGIEDVHRIDQGIKDVHRINQGIEDVNRIEQRI